MNAKIMLMFASSLSAWEQKEHEHKERMRHRGILSTCPTCKIAFGEIGKVFCSDECKNNYSKEN